MPRCSAALRPERWFSISSLRPSISCSPGTSGLIAQAFGRGDALEERAAFWRAFVIAAISGLALILLAPLISAVGEWFMNAEPALTSAMDVYVRVRLLSAPAVLINYAILGYFLGRGEAAVGLCLQLLLNGMNIALCIFLGLYLGWGVAGVAWATVCGEVAAMIAGMVVLLGRFSAMPKISPRHTFNIAAIRWMLHVNVGIMIRSFVVMGAYILFTRQGAQLGTLTLAANAVLMHFFWSHTTSSAGSRPPRSSSPVVPSAPVISRLSCVPSG